MRNKSKCGLMTQGKFCSKTSKSPKTRETRFGGKKDNTIKFEEIIDQKTRKIVSVSRPFPEWNHDFQIRRCSNLIPTSEKVLADSGYIEIKNIHKKTIFLNNENEEKCCPLKNKNTIRRFERFARNTSVWNANFA